jgi:hypothetical protein
VHDDMLEAQDGLSSAQQPLNPNYCFEDCAEPTCRQAYDALEVVLRFMKNESDSRYKDVVMLQELKEKLREKLEAAADPIEIEEIEYAFEK